MIKIHLSWFFSFVSPTSPSSRRVVVPDPCFEPCLFHTGMLLLLLIFNKYFLSRLVSFPSSNFNLTVCPTFLRDFSFHILKSPPLWGNTVSNMDQIPLQLSLSWLVPCHKPGGADCSQSRATVRGHLLGLKAAGEDESAGLFQPGELQDSWGNILFCPAVCSLSGADFKLPSWMNLCHLRSQLREHTLQGIFPLLFQLPLLDSVVSLSTLTHHPWLLNFYRSWWWRLK